MNINQAPKPQSNRPQYVAEEGMQLGVIIQIIDLGVQKQRPYQGQVKDPARMVRVTYELVNDLRDFDGEEKPLIVSEEFKFSGDDRSTCYKRLNSMDPGFKKSGGDWTKMVGHPVQIQIVHNQGKGDNAGRTFANIASVSPLMKGMPAPESTFNELLVFNTDSPSKEVFDKLPPFMQDKIMGGEQPPTMDGTAQKETSDDFSSNTAPEPEESEEDDWA